MSYIYCIKYASKITRLYKDQLSPIVTVVHDINASIQGVKDSNE